MPPVVMQTSEDSSKDNPFQPELSPINDTVAALEHISDRNNAQTPAFNEEKKEIPVVSSPDVVSKEEEVSKDGSSSPASRDDSSNFVRVKLSPMKDASAFSRDRSMNRSRGVSSHSQISAEAAEWKTTGLK